MTAGIKRLFWDIETSPGLDYSWRCGYKINISSDNIVREPAIICISYKIRCTFGFQFDSLFKP